MVVVLQTFFIGWNFDRVSINILDHTMLAPSPNHPLRSMDYTHPYWPLIIPGSTSQWITCSTYHPQSMEMTMFLWLLIGSLKWPFLYLARRISRPSSSLSMYGFISGSHRQSFLIKIESSSVHFGPSYGHCWTPSSPNPLPSIPKLMVK